MAYVVVISDVSGRQKSGSGRVRGFEIFFGFGSSRVLIFFSGSGRVRVANVGFRAGFGFNFGV